MSVASLVVSVEQVGRVTVALLAGPIDSATLDQFKQGMDSVVMKPQPGLLLVDCSGLTYVNSKGLAMFTGYHRKCFAERGYFALCNVNRKLVRTMDLLGLGRVLKFYETRDEALAAMQNMTAG